MPLSTSRLPMPRGGRPDGERGIRDEEAHRGNGHGCTLRPTRVPGARRLGRQWEGIGRQHDDCGFEHRAGLVQRSTSRRRGRLRGRRCRACRLGMARGCRVVLPRCEWDGVHTFPNDGGDLVSAQLDDPGIEFVLGGGNSQWLSNGGTADCNAVLYAYGKSGNNQTIRELASTGRSHAGADLSDRARGGDGETEHDRQHDGDRRHRYPPRHSLHWFTIRERAGPTAGPLRSFWGSYFCCRAIPSIEPAIPSVSNV